MVPFVPTRRAISAPLAAVLLVALTVASAAVVGAALVPPAEEPAPRAAFDLQIDARTDAVALVHAGGDPVAPSRLRLQVAVDGAPLSRQPPVPFFSAPGFRPGPTGPFNRGWTGEWRAGDRAELRLAGSNAGIDPGDSVHVRLYAGEYLLADLRASA